MPEPDAPGGVVCAFCRRQRVDPAWRPFCSERCRLQDLARWVDGVYRVPGEQVDQREELEVRSKKEPDQP
jgi:endogenous inhibitor of DNA gyrase (YacG/DUF329 family)